MIKRLAQVLDNALLTMIAIVLGLMVYATSDNALAVIKLFSTLTFVYAALSYIEIREMRREHGRKNRVQNHK